MTWLLAVFALWIALMAPAMRSRHRRSGPTLHRRQRNYLRLENLFDPVIPDVKVWVNTAPASILSQCALVGTTTSGVYMKQVEAQQPFLPTTGFADNRHHAIPKLLPTRCQTRF